MKYSIAMVVVLLLAGSLAAAQSIQDGLVAYWPLNEMEGGTATDVTGNGHDGVLNGDPQWTEGMFGGCLEFDGSEDEVNVPFSADLNPDDSYTVCAWANVAVGSSGYRAVVSSRDDFPQRGYIIYCEPGNTWQQWIGAGGWGSIQGPAAKLGEWMHVAALYDNGHQMFYVDGELAGEAQREIEVNTAQVFLIGAGANERATHEYLFVGKIDDVRVYNRALSQDEIKLVMANEAMAVEPSDKLPTFWAAIK